jgi:hypothetical protein
MGCHRGPSCPGRGVLYGAPQNRDQPSDGPAAWAPDQQGTAIARLARSGPAGGHTLARQLVALPTRDGAALRIRFVLDKQINAVAIRQRKLNYP